MITINHLEFLFDAEQQRDEVVFARLFEQHIDAWERRHRQDKHSAEQAEMERSIGPRPEGGVA